MALNDWINRQNSIDSKTLFMEQLFDRVILSAQNRCIEMTVNRVYDQICREVASAISASSLAEGDVAIPIRTESVDVKKILKDIVVHQIQDQDRMPFFILADKKFADSPFIYDNAGDNDDTTTLEILTPVSITAGLGPKGRIERSKETFQQGAFWHPFWDALSKLAKADGIQMIYRIEVKEGTVIKGTFRKTWKHSHYVDFGQYVHCIHISSKHVWENYYSISPVISYSYRKRS